MYNLNISIIEIARHCNIRTKETGRRETPCWCPFCGGDKGKPTASINATRGLFHCFRCGEGCNSLTLFAKVYGVNNKQAYSELVTLGTAA